VSHRARALSFAAAAAICGGLAASAAGGPAGGLEAQLGELRPVVVATRALPPGRPLSRRAVRRALEVRRVPERFLPPDALGDPAQALGRAPAAPIPAGGYLVGSQLEAPRAEEDDPPPRLEAGRRPVEIAVAGAGALAELGRGPRVDVIVTSEPGPGGGAGRTYVAVRSVGLLDLRPADEAAGTGDPLAGPTSEAWIATLALTRAQALRLIQAESFARSVRLIGR
jgi:Flp pilus assembly protein CpaB